MSDQTFRALVVSENADGSFQRKIKTKHISELPSGEVLIKAKYAGLNYKDALSASGHKGITKQFPHTPGVDVSGIVEECSDDSFNTGDSVIVTGYDLGMNTSGGFQEYVRVPSEWVVKKPEELSLYESMILGTAGFTAALSLYKLEKMGQTPHLGEILVTGATGGVGSMAVGILSKAGYNVIATTGNDNAKPYLTKLGAHRIEPRSFSNDDSGRPLLRSRWAGAIDTVGGSTLETCVKACAPKGSVAACGLVSSDQLNMTVYPFLLNGVNILGVDSAETEMPIRVDLWNKLANQWKIDNLKDYATQITLDEIIHHIDLIIKGKTQGRVVVAF